MDDTEEREDGKIAREKNRKNENKRERDTGQMIQRKSGDDNKA